MRVKIRAEIMKPAFIPFNYQYQLHSAIIGIINKSSPEYAEFLHKLGFAYEKEVEQFGKNTVVEKIYKYYTFSHLKFFPKIPTKGGFKNIRQVEFIFSTSVDKNFEHVILGLFADNQFHLQFHNDNRVNFQIQQVETLPEKNFSNKEKFLCLSPILVTTEIEKKKHHCLDYMIPDEREKFVENLKQNLIRKYEGFYHKEFTGSQDFEFSFDPVYIAKKNGNISKLISINKNNNNLKFKGFEAPFSITADPELIKMGYDSGFGANNAMGWGCVKKVE